MWDLSSKAASLYCCALEWVEGRKDKHPRLQRQCAAALAYSEPVKLVEKGK